jgi:proteasome beta subunit
VSWTRDELVTGIPRPFDAAGSSFFEVLRERAPAAVPPLLNGQGMPPEMRAQMVEGTTVLAVTTSGGVVIAGDRRATAGHQISRGDMRKVFPADQTSAIAISGAAGPAMELARVFATELEHYEKVEGEPLSLEGKSNKLAGMVRAHLPMAMQGLVIVPLFAGVDPRTGEGSIFEYDPVGGRYEARDHAATGSGSLAARATLKRLHRYEDGVDAGVRTAVEALFDAAEEDSATGGPDLIRRIYPIVAVIDDTDGYHELPDEQVLDHIEGVIALRQR